MACYDIPERTKSVASRNGDSLLDVASGTDEVLLRFHADGRPGCGAVGALALRMPRQLSRSVCRLRFRDATPAAAEARRRGMLGFRFTTF